MEEQYKIINGFSNYEISNFGNVRNIKTGKILKQCFNNSGYKMVNIMDEGKQSAKQIHRLIAMMFIPNPNNKTTIDHIDNDKANNNINNLRWVTQQENSSNRSLSKKNTSGNKGVCFNKKLNKWQAQIMYKNIIKHLGLFDNKEDAIIARVNKANELFGEFINKCEKLPEQIELEELDKELTRLINS